jgi:hypothetical protein
MNVPDQLIYPLEPFAEDFAFRVREGQANLRLSSVCFVGLARNCQQRLYDNLRRLVVLGNGCDEWRLHIETNDNADQTDQVLAEFCREHRRATFTSQRLDRKQYSTEFAGRRTQAMAEYRDACQRWVRDNAADSDYVVVIDFDQWGGWSHVGVLNGIGWLIELPGAYGMASVSLMQHPAYQTDALGKTSKTNVWLHYDAWALRLNSYWDDYTAGYGGWKHHWLPPVGSPPVLVKSAMGGLAIYRTEAFLTGTYDGSDCEHVPFHESIAKATGQHLYLNPSQRCVMSWVTDGGEHHAD